MSSPTPNSGESELPNLEVEVRETQGIEPQGAWLYQYIRFVRERVRGTTTSNAPAAGSEPERQLYQGSLKEMVHNARAEVKKHANDPKPPTLLSESPLRNFPARQRVLEEGFLAKVSRWIGMGKREEPQTPVTPPTPREIALKARKARAQATGTKAMVTLGEDASTERDASTFSVAQEFSASGENRASSVDENQAQQVEENRVRLQYLERFSEDFLPLGAAAYVLNLSPEDVEGMYENGTLPSVIMDEKGRPCFEKGALRALFLEHTSRSLPQSESLTAPEDTPMLNPDNTLTPIVGELLDPEDDSSLDLDSGSLEESPSDSGWNLEDSGEMELESGVFDVSDTSEVASDNKTRWKEPEVHIPEGPEGRIAFLQNRREDVPASLAARLLNVSLEELRKIMSDEGIEALLVIRSDDDNDDSGYEDEYDRSALIELIRKRELPKLQSGIDKLKAQPVKFLTPAEAGDILSLTPKEVVELRDKGDIHGYRDGNSWKFKKEHVEQALYDLHSLKLEDSLAEDDPSSATAQTLKKDEDFLLTPYDEMFADENDSPQTPPHVQSPSPPPEQQNYGYSGRSRFMELNEAAQIIGVTPDRLVEMRSNGDIHGYRDGATWKFKSEEVDRAAREASESDSSLSSLELPEDEVDLDELSEDDGSGISSLELPHDEGAAGEGAAATGSEAEPPVKKNIDHHLDSEVSFLIGEKRFQEAAERFNAEKIRYADIRANRICKGFIEQGEYDQASIFLLAQQGKVQGKFHPQNWANRIVRDHLGRKEKAPDYSRAFELLSRLRGIVQNPGHWALHIVRKLIQRKEKRTLAELVLASFHAEINAWSELGTSYWEGKVVKAWGVPKSASGDAIDPGEPQPIEEESGVSSLELPEDESIELDTGDLDKE